MEKLEEQIKIPTRLTYRAVGSGTGQKEFLGKVEEPLEVSRQFCLIFFVASRLRSPPPRRLPQADKAYNDFGAGDIPIPSADRDAYFAKGIEFVQLPFVLSAVTFFHNIPGVPAYGDSQLQMTACLLARIFKRDITTWDHPDILAINPNLNVAPDYPIFVGRRVKGSSSTYSITHYLRAQCPEEWDEEDTASTVDWHPDTKACDGSGPMTACLKNNEGSIGYIDAAHGHENGLTEIHVRNGDGRYLTTVESGVVGVQEAATDLSAAPPTADGDFSDVAFYNMPGTNTWPISLVSYVYIRKDLSHMTDVRARSLVKAFATALFDPEYIGLCDRYGLLPVPEDLKQLSLAGLDLVDAGEGAPEWKFEKDTMVGEGAGDYVISKKRKSFGLYEADRLADDVGPLAQEVRELKLQLAELRSVQGLTVSAAGGKAVRTALGATAVVAAAMGFLL